MTRQQPPTSARLTRRSALGLIGAAPLAVGGSIALAGTAQAGTAPTKQPPRALLPGGAYETYVSGLAAKDLFSGTILLAWHGEPTLVRSYQDSNKAKNIPNRPDTIFNLASLTKFFTGLAVVQLATQAKVDFSATIGTYLNDFPSAVADTVTVHHLLTHTSGLQEVINTAAYHQVAKDWTTPAAAFTGTLNYIRQLPDLVVSAAGTKYAYTNTDYFLAGAIVASASGQKFWDYIPQHIFNPARMTSTAFYTGQQWLNDPRIAHNYGPPQTGGQRQDITSNPGLSGGPNGWDGAGGAFSNVTDLLRFACALSDGTLLDSPWVELLGSGKYPITPAQHNPDQSAAQSYLIGYGTEERIVGGQRASGHTGGMEVPVSGSSQPGGGSTALTIYPDLDIVAVVLSNYFLYPGMATFLTEQDRIITRYAS